MKKKARLTKTKVESLLKLANSATPPPWVVKNLKYVVAPCPCCGQICECDQFGVSDDPSCYNSEFIAASCNATAVLCRAWLKLSKENKKLKARKIVVRNIYTKYSSKIVKGRCPECGGSNITDNYYSNKSYHYCGSCEKAFPAPKKSTCSGPYCPKRLPKSIRKTPSSLMRRTSPYEA